MQGWFKDKYAFNDGHGFVRCEIVNETPKHVRVRYACQWARCRYEERLRKKDTSPVYASFDELRDAELLAAREALVRAERAVQRCIDRIDMLEALKEEDIPAMETTA